MPEKLRPDEGAIAALALSQEPPTEPPTAALGVLLA
jgi:hypothetical protein